MLESSSPRDLLRQRRLYAADCQDRLSLLIEQKLTAARHQLELYIEELKGLSPLYKLKGGYAYVAREDGSSVKSVDEISPGQELALYMQDGHAVVNVKYVRKAEGYGSKENDT